MKDAVRDLERTVEQAAARLLLITDEEARRPRSGGKWSAKEIIGHLIDSASNNHQRFVRAQFTDELVFPGYEQELWVRAQAYNEESWPRLVRLWEHFNLHLAHVMLHSDERARLAERAEHNLHEIGWAEVEEGAPATLEHLMLDYIGHLKNHLRQIFAGD